MPFCSINNVDINYEIMGEGKPIVMIHGFTPDSRLMQVCMEPIFAMRNGYKRIYFDLPGMGKTKGDTNINTTDDMLNIVLKFIDTIIPGQSFLLAGESYGGYLARGIIANRPEKVKGVAFICPLIIPDFEKRSLPSHTIIVEDKTFLNQLNELEEADFRSNNVVLDKKTWVRYKDEIVSGCSIADQDFLSKIRNNYGFSFEIDKIKFNEPSLFLLGLQDSVVGFKDAFAILEKFPRATFAILDKAGHNLQIEQEDLFNSLITEWLDRVVEVEEGLTIN
ncbi:2-hydroxy-6-oxo-6-phenylhexa-2,4-dienoate hydrolase [Bacillus sp. FJAT-25509]|uniref:alpha/beta fold hydrolase n=1 Tax=Bacillaceae TaxID=186817 RepID=UPI0006FE0085|nr:alpha/beta hydrolase [Bacillus sp. FJAT-25509]KQL37778.1 2-hydroxy-6-oxo-6-phenylhexa-2,4-dienoate hydrolase [Bacillus sp. FJAT-25509]